MHKKQRKMLARILISAVLFAALQIAGPEGWQRIVLYLIPYAIIGWDVLWRAVRNIARGQVFDENFLMALATVGAFGCGEYPEGVAVMLFYQVGELFQTVAVNRSRRSIAQLMDIRPDHANVEQDGQWVQVDPEEVQEGQRILVKPGERIPLDGIVEDGTAALDTAALTGESAPQDVEPGQRVLSGCVDLNGALVIRVEQPYAQSTVARILELVENASSQKARAEQFITRFARYYTPCVVIAAVLLAVLPSLITGQWLVWIHRALVFLVVSCPCALVISVPLAFFGGIGGASRQGILVKGGNYLEALAHVDAVVFDKTGTLTEGSFRVAALTAVQGSQEELLELAALAESWSSHPIAQSLRQAWNGQPEAHTVTEVQEQAGHGVSAVVDGRQVVVGNERLMAAAGIQVQTPQQAGTVVHTAADGVYLGWIVVADQPKDGAAQAIAALRQAGIRKTVMLTGDSRAVADQVARALGLDQVEAELLPGDKVERLEMLLKSESEGAKLAYVGDGINDAPVLARADVGIAMGAMGSDAAIEAADVVLMDDNLQKLPAAIRLARKTMRIVRQNIVFALGVKAVVLLLGAVGAAGMWAAVFADVGVSVLAILNSTRMLRAK